MLAGPILTGSECGGRLPCGLAIRHNKKQKKERRTTAAPRTPTKGQNKTAWPALPFGSAVQVLLLLFKSLSAQVGRFRGSRNLTLARHSIVLLAAVTGPPISCVYLIAVVISHSTVPTGKMEYTTHCA